MAFTRKLVACVTAIAIAACAEPVTSPLAPALDPSGLRNATLVRGCDGDSDDPPTCPVLARATVDALLNATVQLTTGTFPSFNPFTGTIDPGVAPGIITHVRLSFCAAQKPAGYKNFSANFDYSPKGVDREPDLIPDSPLDPDDKIGSSKSPVSQVYWDRSAKHTTLTGGGTGALSLANFPQGAALQVEMKYSLPVGVKKDGSIEYKSYDYKDCIIAERAPDIFFSGFRPPSNVRVDVARLFLAFVDVNRGGDVPTTATCSATVTPLFPATVVPTVGPPVHVAVSNAGGDNCFIRITFREAGEYQVTFKLEDISPGDANLDNNSKTVIVTVT